MEDPVSYVCVGGKDNPSVCVGGRSSLKLC